MNPESDLKASVDRDVSCVTCGYNLRGLQEEGRCPECGEKVSDTLENVLAMADRVMLGQLNAAAAVLLISRIILALGIFTVFLPDTQREYFLNILALHILFSLILYIGGLLLLAGTYWDLLKTKPRTSHYLFFILLIFIFLGTPISLYIALTHGTVIWLLAMIPLYFEVATSGFVGGIANIANDNRLFRVTERIKYLIWSVMAVIGIVILLDSVLSIMPWSGLEIAKQGRIIGNGFRVVASVLEVIILLNVIILWRFRRMLKPYCVGA